MTNEWPVSARQRRSRGARTVLRRLFGVFVPARRNTPETGESGQREGRAGSNAEYHLTIRQLKRIVEAGRNFRDRVLLQTLADTGIRRAELSQLLIMDIRWSDGFLVIRAGKGNKTRVVPMTSLLAQNLKDLVGDRGQGPVFQSRLGGHLSLRQLNRIVSEAGRRVGIRNPNPWRSNITCHLFRHSFARLWKDRKGSIETLSRILGHASVKTTWDLYGREGIEDIKRNYARVMERQSS